MRRSATSASTIRVLGAVLLAAMLAVPASRASDRSADAVIALLAREDPLVVDGLVLNGPLLRELYEGRDGSRLWQGRVDAVTAVLRDGFTEGLDPAAYHFTAIANHSTVESDERAAALDLLVSDAVLRYASDVRFGRSRPKLTSEVALAPRPDPVPLVRTVAASSDVATALHDLAPAQPAYRALHTALANYRAALAKGQRWPLVPDGPTLRPGMVDPAVPALRARLVASGQLRADQRPASQTYDPRLVAAVKAFEETHGLSQDGVVGSRVRAALNVGLASRIEQLVVNMERWRWLPEDLGSPYVMVNIAAARVRMVEHDETRFEAPVIVGEPDKMTPMFSSAITHVVFNPSWTVPDKIARKELLPKVQHDADYFAKQGIRLIGTWHPAGPGDDPSKVDWTGAHGAVGFRLRQAPGPQNPLGRVKFDIPNVFGVYLHDTSNRNLFGRDKRTLSHGCVRVGNALAFAELLLADVPSWNAERRDRILSDWKTTTITLATPVPVHLVYETAWVASDGRPHFLDDVYGRDRRLADALAGRPVEPVNETIRTAEP